MKAISTFSGLFVLLLSLSACSSPDSSNSESTSQEETTTTPDTYTADVSNLELKWTAYKFTDKLGVSGVFDNCTARLRNNSSTIEELLTGAKMTIATTSVNSNNEIRDAKLRDSFFKVFNTEVITAKIISADSGKGVMELTMNEIPNNLDFNYSLKSDTVFLNTSLDLLLWKGKEAMDSLNTVCYDLHKGVDGRSKLWPDVDVSLSIPVK